MLICCCEIKEKYLIKPHGMATWHGHMAWPHGMAEIFAL